jgi:hypothetical protein
VTRACTAALVLLGILACPVGTLVCRMQCLISNSQPAQASSPCEQHGVPTAPTLRADTTVCDEGLVVTAVKQERIEDPRPAPVDARLAALEPPPYRSPEHRPFASSPPPEPPFSGTNLPLRI